MYMHILMFSFIDVKLYVVCLVEFVYCMFLYFNLYFACFFIWSWIYIYIYVYLYYMWLEIVIVCFLYWIVIVINFRTQIVHRFYFVYCVLAYLMLLWHLWMYVFELTWHWHCMRCISLFGIVYYVFLYLNSYLVFDI